MRKAVVQMITGYVRRGQHVVGQWLRDPVVHRIARGGLHLLAGFCLSAASLVQGMLPLVMGLVWACRSWRAVLVAAGGMLGYGVFWGESSLQGMVWTALALAGVLLLGERKISREAPLLIPATGMLMVSAAGLAFQLLADDPTPVPLYLLRVALGGCTPWLFNRWMQHREPVTEWFCTGLFALGLAQIVPVRWLGLGYVAVGLAAVRSAFPSSAIVGLALDLARVTPVPMTAVAVGGFLVRLLPRTSRWFTSLAPGILGLLMMRVCGQWDWMILPGLFLGGISGGFFPSPGKAVLRRGETGTAQVRLEMAAQTLHQTGRILREIPERVVDEQALVRRAVECACAGCSARDRCRDIRRVHQLPGDLLRNPLLTIEEIPVRCKKGNRILAELRRAQDQLRTIRADRQLQEEYRAAVIQQYDFLEQFLHSLSDDLARRCSAGKENYTPVISVYGSRSSTANGDRCIQVAGRRNQYYIVLCDGMGTGSGAVQEGKTASELLGRLLACGFPAAYALGSLNSICALRDRAGVVTVDLAELDLETGRVNLYKWGGAASFLLTGDSIRKLEDPTPPPGFAVPDERRISATAMLKKGQLLLMTSDGLDPEQVLEVCREKGGSATAVLAEEILRSAHREDDATVVAIQLVRTKMG